MMAHFHAHLDDEFGAPLPPLDSATAHAVLDRGQERGGSGEAPVLHRDVATGAVVLTTEQVELIALVCCRLVDGNTYDSYLQLTTALKDAGVRDFRALVLPWVLANAPVVRAAEAQTDAWDADPWRPGGWREQAHEVHAAVRAARKAVQP